VDHEVHPGGVWAGDYWIVEYEPLRKEPELSLAVAMHRGLLHRTKEVWLVRENDSIRFPLGERRTMLARLPPGMQAADGDPLSLTLRVLTTLSLPLAIWRRAC
jgi:hypothetical protein